MDKKILQIKRTPVLEGRKQNKKIKEILSSYSGIALTMMFLFFNNVSPALNEQSTHTYMI